MADDNVEVTITVKRRDLETLLRKSGGDDAAPSVGRTFGSSLRSQMPDWYESYLNVKQALKWADTNG